MTFWHQLWLYNNSKFFLGLKLNLNGEFKFDIYQVEIGNNKSVSKTYHSTKNMHTAFILFYFVNQQLQNCCLLSNEWFTKNCDTIYTMVCKKSRISLEVRKQVTLEHRSVDNTKWMLFLPQHSWLEKMAECQPNRSLSIIKYTRNTTDSGLKFDKTVTENHLWTCSQINIIRHKHTSTMLLNI